MDIATHNLHRNRSRLGFIIYGGSDIAWTAGSKKITKFKAGSRLLGLPLYPTLDFEKKGGVRIKLEETYKLL